MTETFANPPAEAVSLADAIARFTPPDLWREYQRKSSQRRQLPRRPVFRMDEDNSVATATRTIQADLNRLLRRIKLSLIERLVAGDLIAYGQTEAPFGPWQRIPPAAWRGLRIADIRKGRVTGTAMDIAGVHIVEAAAHAAPDPDSMRNDAPGRPSWFHVIAAEFDRRAEAGDIEESLNKQAVALAAWYAATYPGHQPYRPATIRNRLREKYREIVSTMA